MQNTIEFDVKSSPLFVHTQSPAPRTKGARDKSWIGISLAYRDKIVYRKFASREIITEDNTMRFVYDHLDYQVGDIIECGVQVRDSDEEKRTFKVVQKINGSIVTMLFASDAEQAIQLSTELKCKLAGHMDDTRYRDLLTHFKEGLGRAMDQADSEDQFKDNAITLIEDILEHYTL